MISWEDQLRVHPIYVRAAIAASEVSIIIVFIYLFILHVTTNRRFTCKPMTTPHSSRVLLQPVSTLSQFCDSFPDISTAGLTDEGKKAKKKAKKAAQKVQEEAKKGTYLWTLFVKFVR